MGFGGISIWQMLIVLAIVVMIFGTKKLRNAGGDLGSAIKNFKKNVKDGEAEVKGEPEQLEKTETQFSADQNKETSNKDA